MKAKEQWVNETLDSFEGLKRAAADPETFGLVMRQLQHAEQKRAPLSYGIFLRIAAGLALLITVNVISLVYYHQNDTLQNIQKSLDSEYFSYIDNLNP